MDSSVRIVVQIPLTELWNDSGVVTSSKKRQLRRNEISELLRTGRVRFVMADCGDPLKWIDPVNCFDFWKTEAKPRVVEPDEFFWGDFPDQQCYVASEWADGGSLPIVLLEKFH